MDSARRAAEGTGLRVVAKARVLEITLSVMGAGEDEYPNPDVLAIENTASGDRLVISVRVRRARKYARPWAKAGSVRTT